METTVIEEAGSEGEDNPQTWFAGIQNGTISQDQFIAYIEKIKKLADHDGLTGLLNLKGFLKSLGQELELVKRFQLSAALLALDVDKFKSVNDTLGHPEGDRMLQAYAQVIRENTRSSDLQARAINGRVGGDEFLVLLVGADANGAEIVAERIRVNIITLVKANFPDLPQEQTVSIGITEVLKDDSGKSLRQRADQALYQAKKERNKTIIFMAHKNVS